jgi:hypothetical protein
LSVGLTPKINRSMPRHMASQRRQPNFWRLFGDVSGWSQRRLLEIRSRRELANALPESDSQLASA